MRCTACSGRWRSDPLPGRGDLEQVERSLALIDRGGQRISDCVRRLQRFSATATPRRARSTWAWSSVPPSRSRATASARGPGGDRHRRRPRPGICVESHVSQVVMNLLLNAADAAESSATTSWSSPIGADGARSSSGLRLGRASPWRRRIASSAATTAARRDRAGAGHLISPRRWAAPHPRDRAPGGASCPPHPGRRARRPEHQPDRAACRRRSSSSSSTTSRTGHGGPPRRHGAVRDQRRAARLAWTTDYNWVISDIVCPGVGLDLRAWVAERHPV